MHRENCHVFDIHKVISILPASAICALCCAVQSPNLYKYIWINKYALCTIGMRCEYVESVILREGKRGYKSKCSMHLVVEIVYRWFLAMGIAHNQMLTHLIFLLMMMTNKPTNGHKCNSPGFEWFQQFNWIELLLLFSLEQRNCSYNNSNNSRGKRRP